MANDFSTTSYYIHTSSVLCVFVCHTLIEWDAPSLPAAYSSTTASMNICSPLTRKRTILQWRYCMCMVDFLLAHCLYCARNVLCAPHSIDPMFLVLLFCPLSSLYQFPQTPPLWCCPHWKRQWQRASTRATSCTAQHRFASTCNSHTTSVQYMYSSCMHEHSHSA